MRSLLIRLYPARWRVRYADEFEATLEEIVLGPFDVVDILLGAIDAHLRMRERGAAIRHERGLSMSLRLGGFAAILLGAVFTIGFILSTGLLGSISPSGQLLVWFAGSLALLIAVLGLNAFQSRTHPALAWGGVAMPAIGAIIFIVGIVGLVFEADGFWDVGVIGLFAILIGSVIFAVATYRAGVLSRAAAALLGAGAAVLVVLMINAASDFPLGALTGPIGLFGLIAFPLGWAALGVHAIRIDRPTTAARPA